MIKGKCAKQVVTCILETVKGEQIVGKNWCANPQEQCPRLSGEGYEKCKSICKQYGHAEDVVLELAGEKAKGATATLIGHDHFCASCQRSLFGAGVASLKVDTKKRLI